MNRIGIHTDRHATGDGQVAQLKVLDHSSGEERYGGVQAQSLLYDCLQIDHVLLFFALELQGLFVGQILTLLVQRQKVQGEGQGRTGRVMALEHERVHFLPNLRVRNLQALLLGNQQHVQEGQTLLRALKVAALRLLSHLVQVPGLDEVLPLADHVIRFIVQDLQQVLLLFVQLAEPEEKGNAQQKVK